MVAMAMPLIDAALRGALLALLALLAVALWRTHSRQPLVRLGLLLACGLAVQTLSGWPALEQQAPALWRAPWVGISVGNALLFWLFVRALFEDDFVLKPWHAGLWLGVAALGTAAISLTAWPHTRGTLVCQGLLAVLHALPVAFAALAVWAAVRQAAADLVERRRRLRVIIFVFGALYTLVMAALRLGSARGTLSAAGALLDTAGLFTTVALAAAQLLRVSGSSLLLDTEGNAPVPAPASTTPPFAQAFTSSEAATAAPAGAKRLLPPASAPSPSPSLPMAIAAQPQAPLEPPSDGSAPSPADSQSPADDRLAQDLARLMGEPQRYYRTEDLSVAALARKLATPEYRLRRVINQRLGHRNFNAYLNGFRLAETRAALADPAQRHMPILTIALTAGFGSIGPFNRAFKTATGLTPTEFRQQHLG